MADLVDFKKKYGKLTILEESDSLKLPCGQTNRVFDCLCECGKHKKVRWSHLKRGKINSCGCILKTKKGLSSSVYGILLNSMVTRCKDNYTEKHLYFNKGITVCKEWLNDIELFVDFCKLNGYKKGLHIDRINNSKGYYPENCRFVTPKENCNNRDNTFYVNYKDKKVSLQMILSELGKQNDYSTIRARIKRGVNHNKAIDKPITIGNYSKTNFNRN
jgi:hypothetical protein